MLKPAGIPTGAYQLLRVATPLDPDPKGPVYDGGLLVSEGLPAVVASSPVVSFAASPDSQEAQVSTADELRNKYLFIDVRNENTALLTLPERHSRGDVLIDSNNLRFSSGKTTPLSQETLTELMEDERFRKPVLSATDIRVCGLVPGSPGLRGVRLDLFLKDRGIQLPLIEDLTVACAIHYATTGRHLIPLGRTVKAANGVIRTSRMGGQLKVFLNDLDRFSNDFLLVAAGTVRPGEQSVLPTRRSSFMQLIERMTGLSWG
jgi:hypothetical protein